MDDLNGRPFTDRLSTDRCSIYYLIHSIIIINKQIQSIAPKQEEDADPAVHDDGSGSNAKSESQSKMHFPPTRITTAHLLKQKSNGSVHRGNNEEDEANCAFCFDSVEPPFTAHCSPKHKGFPMTMSPAPRTFKLFPAAHRDEVDEGTPSPLAATAMK